MKKVLNNILKWLICVFLTFSVVFTIVQYESIIEGIYFGTSFFGNDEKYTEFFGEENLKEMTIWHEEITNSQFEYERNTENDILNKLYTRYPAGVTRTMCIISDYIVCGQTAIISLILGIIIGTAIYMLLDTDKKGFKIVITLYILSIVILGFVQGFINISGEDLTLLDRWMFPDEYIIPVSIVFALVVLVRVMKQKEIAKKLNEKLSKIKAEKSK